MTNKTKAVIAIGASPTLLWAIASIIVARTSAPNPMGESAGFGWILLLLFGCPITVVIGLALGALVLTILKQD